MALKERTVLGKVTINHQSGGHCEVQEVKEIYDDITGEVKSSNFHRLVVTVGDDVEADKCGVKHITDNAWTSNIRESQKEKDRLESLEKIDKPEKYKV